MTDRPTTIRDLLAMLDEAINVVSDYEAVLERVGTEGRLRDLSHKPEIIKKAIFVLYSLLPNPAVQHLIQTNYPKNMSGHILSEKFWDGLFAGIMALPTFLSDSEAELRAAFVRKEKLSDADLMRVLEILKRIRSEGEALLKEGEQWCPEGTNE